MVEQSCTGVLSSLVIVILQLFGFGFISIKEIVFQLDSVGCFVETLDHNDDLIYRKFGLNVRIAFGG